MNSRSCPCWRGLYICIKISVISIKKILLARHSTPTPRAGQLRIEPESLYGGEGLCSAIYISILKPLPVWRLASFRIPHWVLHRIMNRKRPPFIRSSSIRFRSASSRLSSSPSPTRTVHTPLLCIVAFRPPCTSLAVFSVSRDLLYVLQSVFHQLVF